MLSVIQVYSYVQEKSGTNRVLMLYVHYVICQQVKYDDYCIIFLLY